MPVEIQMLVCSVALFAILIAIQATAATMQMGARQGLGNRDHVAPITGWAARAQRCEDNQLVSLVLFAPLALSVVLLKHTDHWSALGATLYLYARIGFAACYLIGIPYLRTVCWAAGMAGIALTGYALYV